MKLKHITKKYGDTAALDDVTLDIEEGKVTAVLGESGAGKTTLLNVIAGNLPFGGTVEGAGKVSYLFQTPKLLPNLTVEGNLKFVLDKEDWGNIAHMLRKIGLDGKERAYPAQLSGGERQRVAIARAFLFPHDVLLMDEPFSSLDLSLKKSLLDLIGELRRDGKETVVFVTHDVHEAALLSHRAVLLRKGRVTDDIAIGGEPPRNFFSHPEEEERLIHALMGE